MFLQPVGVQLVSIQTSPNDRLLWALDNRGSVFVRTGLSEEMPVGTDWDLVPGTPLPDCCLPGGLSVCSVSRICLCLFGRSGCQSAGRQLSDRLGSVCKRRAGSALWNIQPEPRWRLLEEDSWKH